MDLSELNDIALFEEDAPVIPAEERKDSDYLDAAFAGRRVTPLEERDKRVLVRQAQDGDITARNKLVEHDMPLIVQLAGRYLHKGLTFDDIVQAGVIGMITAVERFDLEMGVKLNTYTVPWILKEMRESLYRYGKTIRLPKQKYQQLYEIRRARARFEDMHGRYPELRELAEIMDLAPADIDELLVFNGEPVSMETNVADVQDGFLLLGDTIEDESCVSGEDLRQSEETQGLLPQYIARLKPQYQTFVIRRFGLDGEPEMLLEELGQVLGVSRARAGQVQILALKALREMIEKDGLSLSDLL